MFIEFAQKKNNKKVKELKELNLPLHRKLPVKSQFIDQGSKLLLSVIYFVETIYASLRVVGAD